MRPPAQPSSDFFHPLDAILGTPAAVRILRVLSLHRGAMSRTAIAERSGLGRAGASRAIERLVRARVIASSGDPSRPLFELSDEHPLATKVRKLFQAEAERADDFFERVRDAASTIRPAAEAIWLIGSAAQGEDSVASDVAVAVVFSNPGRPALKPFNAKIHDAAAVAGLRVSLSGISLAELSEHARTNDSWWQNLVRDAVPLVGRAPASLING